MSTKSLKPKVFLLISLTVNKLKSYSEKERRLEALKVRDLYSTFYPFINVNLRIPTFWYNSKLMHPFRVDTPLISPPL